MHPLIAAILSDPDFSADDLERGMLYVRAAEAQEKLKADLAQSEVPERKGVARISLALRK